MQETDFISPFGKITPASGGYRTFVPNPLPPTLELAKVLGSLAECASALGELQGAAKRTENPYILIEPLQRREALTTSAMEGTFTTMEELLFEEESSTSKTNVNARETANFIRALRTSVRNINDYSVSLRVIKEAHHQLLSGLPDDRGANKRLGEFKNSQNWIGGGRDISKARYVPPSPSDTQIGLNELEHYINRPPPDYYQKLIDLALVHYQFEAIHPFADGNGRIGRMLITLMSINSKLLDLPILYLSPYLEKHKDEYIDLMYGVTTRSDWTAWLNFFFNCITQTCKDTISKIEKLLTLQKNYRVRVAKAGRSAKLAETVDKLFRTPFISIPRLAEHFDITYRAAQLNIEKLVTSGILVERTNSFPRYFIAHEIIAAVNRE